MAFFLIAYKYTFKLIPNHSICNVFYKSYAACTEQCVLSIKLTACNPKNRSSGLGLCDLECKRLHEVNMTLGGKAWGHIILNNFPV